MASPFERAFNPAFQQASAAAMKSLDDERQENRFQQRMLEQRQYDAGLLEGSKAYAANLLKDSIKIDQDRIDAATKLAAQKIEDATAESLIADLFKIGTPPKLVSEARNIGGVTGLRSLLQQGQDNQSRAESDWAGGQGVRLGSTFDEQTPYGQAYRKSELKHAEKSATIQADADLRSVVSSEVDSATLKEAEARFKAVTGQPIPKGSTAASLNVGIEAYNKEITGSEEYKKALDELEQALGKPVEGGLPLEKLKSMLSDVKAIDAMNIRRAGAELLPLPRWIDPDVQIPKVQGKQEIRALRAMDHAEVTAAERSTALADFRNKVDISAISDGDTTAINNAIDALKSVQGLPKSLRDAMASGNRSVMTRAAMEIRSYVRNFPIENQKGEHAGFRLVYANPPELAGVGAGVGAGLEFGPPPPPDAAAYAAAKKAATQAAADKAEIDNTVATANAALTVRNQQITDGIKAKWKAGLFDARTGNAQKAVIESVIKSGGIKLEDVVGEFSSLAFQINHRNYLNSWDGLENAQDKYLDAVKAAAIPNQSVSEMAKKQELVTKAATRLKQAKLTMELLDEELQGIKNNKFTPRIRGSSSKFQPQPTR